MSFDKLKTKRHINQTFGRPMSTAPVVLQPACIKTLSQVEVNPNRSNQHEFNGVAQLKDIFGLSRQEGISAVFSIRGLAGTTATWVTWYDAREDHPTRSEHRLYFPHNAVMSRAKAGDNILIGYDSSKRLHCILIPSGTAGHTPVTGWTVAT